MQIDKIMVVDGTHMLRTYWHVEKTNAEKAGRPIDGPDVVQRFLERLSRLQDHFNLEPPTAIVVFDNQSKGFRSILNRSYKSSRSQSDEYREVENHATEAVMYDSDWKGLVAHDGFEADDVIASVAAQVKCKVIIHGSDKDLNQCLVAGRVKILKSSNVNEQERKLNFEWLNADGLIEKFGFGPGRWVDYQCMVGDSCDDIVGAVGVGEKMATKVIESCSVIDGVTPLCLKPKQRENWVDFQERLATVRYLVELKTKMTLPLFMRHF